ncbi:MAG TPA: hypothetical protein VIJ58_06785 [Candidatus Dormibacteraeota bacterium]
MALPVTRLAIDLTGGLIRVVDGALGGPMRSGSGGTPAGSLVDGKVLDVNAVGSALRQLLARTEIEETRALIAASDAVATFRVLKLPPAASDQDVDAAVARELPLDPERMSTQWLQLSNGQHHRLVYAVSWDRALIKSITDAVRFAGLDPITVDLKSACLARAVAEPACVVLDMASSPAEIVLIDGHVPQVWHSFRLDVAAGDDIGPALAGPLRTVLRFYERRRDTEFEPTAPILIAGEQVLSSHATTTLSQQFEHPVVPLPIPARVPLEIRYTNYLTCLGLLMRRSS